MQTYTCACQGASEVVVGGGTNWGYSPVNPHWSWESPVAGSVSASPGSFDSVSVNPNSFNFASSSGSISGLPENAGPLSSLSGMTIITGGVNYTNCQWTPMAPGCPLHICTIEPSAPQCWPWPGGSSSVNFNLDQIIQPNPGPSSDPLYCLRHPEDPKCWDTPYPPEPFPLPYLLMQSLGALRGGPGSTTVPTNGTPPAMMMMNSGGSSSYLDPCGPWGTPESCAYSKTVGMRGATW